MIKLKEFRTELPTWLKTLLRLLRYKAEWYKQWREISIRKRQLLFLKNFKTETTSLILFLVPGADYKTGKEEISGGMLSIFSIFKETELLKKELGREVVMATLKSNHLLLNYLNFENEVTIVSWKNIFNYFNNLEKIIVHIPEMYSDWFLKGLKRNAINWFKNIKSTHINILNQNIKLMPQVETIYKLRNRFNLVTITTAHQKYCNQHFRYLYGVPLHFFSTFASPENYGFTPYDTKDNLILFSPDDSYKNSLIIKLINKNLPHYKTQVIQNLKYEDYKILIGKAKWVMTFGEGLDFYFIETVFSGGVSFAVFNSQFFTPDFEYVETIFTSFEDLMNSFVDKIKVLDNEVEYNKIQNLQFELCANQYSFKQYQENIRNFYLGNYTYK